MTIPIFASVISATRFIDPDINITNATISDTGAGAEAGIAVQDDGDLLHQRLVGSTDVITDEWILDTEKAAGVMDNYDFRCDVNSGILDTGISDTTGAWLDGAGASQYSWNVSVNSGTGSANVTLSIRDKGTLTVQDTADFVLSAST